MRIKMDAAQVAGILEFALLQDLEPAEMQPQKAGRDSEELKLVDGKPVYRVRVVATEKETKRELSDVSLKVKTKPSGKIGRTFDLKLAGQVVVTPYVTSSNRQGYSIVADGLAEAGK